MGSVAAEADAVTHGSGVSACSKGGCWEGALGLLRTIARRRAEVDAVTFGASVDSCGRAGRWEGALALLAAAACGRLHAGTIACNAAISACEGDGQWAAAVELLAFMAHSRVEWNTVTCSAAISACEKGKTWGTALQLLGALAGAAAEPNAVSFNAAASALASGGEWDRALGQLAAMARCRVELNTITYNAATTACERGCEWAGALQLLAAAPAADAVTCNAAASACARAGAWQRAGALLAGVARRQVRADVVTHAAAASALAGDWPRALGLLGALGRALVETNTICCSAVVSACEKGAEWQRAVALLAVASIVRLRPDAVAHNAAAGACSRAAAWAQGLRLVRRALAGRLEPTPVSYSAAAAGCSEGEHWELALGLLGEVLRRGLELDVISCSAAIIACEKGVQWRHSLRMLPTMQEWKAPAAGNRGLMRLSSTGPPEIAARLERALELQWLYGFPYLPPGEPQLTHGTFKYNAAMQALAAREMLSLAPEAETVLDIFCGSGTVLIEALAAGKAAVGCDASPLAVLAAERHCDAHGIDLPAFLRLADDVSAPPAPAGGGPGWRTLRERIAELPASPLRDALRFALLVALQRAGDGARLLSGAAPLLRSAARLYAARLRALRKVVPQPCRVTIHHSDNRELQLSEPVDALVTGIPYPGVYDYLAMADKALGRAGGADGEPPQDRNGSPAGTERKEIGARALWLDRGLQDFVAEWQAQQERWLRAAFAAVRPGGSATLMLGDGDAGAGQDGGLDALQPTLRAAEIAGFEVVGTASVESSVSSPGRRLKGMRRAEHTVHLARP